MSTPSGYTQIGKHRHIERKDVTDNATGTYFIYQRSCATTHYAKTGFLASGDCPDALHLNPNDKPSGSPNTAGTDRLVRSSVRLNPITGKLYYTADEVAYSSWWKSQPKQPADGGT